MPEINIPERVKRNLTEKELREIQQFEQKLNIIQGTRRAVGPKASDIATKINQGFRRTNKLFKSDTPASAEAKFAQIEDINRELRGVAGDLSTRVTNFKENEKLGRTKDEAATDIISDVDDIIDPARAEDVVKRSQAQKTQKQVVEAGDRRAKQQNIEKRLEEKQEKQLEERREKLEKKREDQPTTLFEGTTESGNEVRVSRKRMEVGGETQNVTITGQSKPNVQTEASEELQKALNREGVDTSGIEEIQEKADNTKILSDPEGNLTMQGTKTTIEQEEQTQAETGSQDPLQQATDFDIYGEAQTGLEQQAEIAGRNVDAGGQSVGGRLFNIGEETVEKSREVSQLIEENDLASSALAATPVGQELTKATTALNEGTARFTEAVKEEDPTELIPGEPDEIINLVGGNPVPGRKTETQKQSEETVAKGLATEPIEDTGAVIGGAGATLDIVEQTTGDPDTGTIETLGTATAFGTAKQAEAFRENPEEIQQEAIGLATDIVPIGGAVATTAGTAASKANTAAPRQVSDQIANIQGFRSGRLGSKVENEQIIGRDIQNLEEQTLEQRLRNLEPTGSQEASAQIAQAVENIEGEPNEFIIRDVETTEEGRQRVAVGIKEGQVIIGERVETPVGRTEFLKDAVTDEQGDIIGIQTTSKGQADLVGEENVPETVKQDTTGRQIDPDEIFGTTEGTQPSARTAETTETSLTPQTKVFADVEELQQPETGLQPQQETRLEEELLPEEQQIPEPQQKQEQRLLPETLQQPEIQQEEQQTTNRPLTVPATQPKNRANVFTTPRPERDPREENLFVETDVDRSPEALPSVDAILFGETTERQVPDDTLFTGTETRKIQEDEEELFKLF